MTNFKDFRCYKDNSLFAKVSTCSILETRCHKCKTIHMYIQGTTTFFDKEIGTHVQYKQTKKFKF